MSDELIEKVAYAIFREHDMHGAAFEGSPYEVSMRAARAALRVIDEDKGDPVTDPSTLQAGDVVAFVNSNRGGLPMQGEVFASGGSLGINEHGGDCYFYDLAEDQVRPFVYDLRLVRKAKS